MKLFNAPSISIQELEARHELSVAAPGDLANEALKKEPVDRSGRQEIYISVEVIG